MKKIFTKIYNDGKWYAGSGSGSLPSNTIKYRKFLKEYIAKNNIKKIIDVGCGDWNFSKLMDWSGAKYMGIDVVEFLIKANKKKYENENIRFVCADAREIQLPEADLLILKDVLQHWSNKEIKKFLQKVRSCENVLALNTCKGENLNEDILNGDMRPLDLGIEPFDYKIEELLRYESFRPVKKVYEIKNVVRISLKFD